MWSVVNTVWIVKVKSNVTLREIVHTQLQGKLEETKYPDRFGITKTNGAVYIFPYQLSESIPYI